MEPDQYLSMQPQERQGLIKKIHDIILGNDKNVIAEVEPMMGKDMIIYKEKGSMKYGMASVKKHITLHVLPIYGSNALHTKYKTLLNKANFQKGCINFTNEEEMPLGIVQQLIVNCSAIDLVKIREDYLKSKKTNNQIKKSKK
jgi:hypothetical protein